MNDLNYNDLNDRIDTLYHSTDSFVSRVPVSDLSVTESTSVSPDGKKLTTVSFGGGPISKEETTAAKHSFTDMVSRLANLKDPLKRDLSSLGHDVSLVEQAINNSADLCLVIDLNNQEKHGYPLTQFRRSELDPLIRNIRKESSIPLNPGRFTNAFTESIVTYEADVCTKDGEFINDFRTMIENAIRSWEDFILSIMPETCGAIAARRALEHERRLWEDDMASRRNKVAELENHELGWVEISGQLVQHGMYVKAKGNNNNSMEHRGFPTQQTVDFEAEEVVPIFDVNFGEQLTLSKQDNRWWMLTCETTEELKLINDYYWELYNPPKFQ